MRTCAASSSRLVAARLRSVRKKDDAAAEAVGAPAAVSAHPSTFLWEEQSTIGRIHIVLGQPGTLSVSPRAPRLPSLCFRHCVDRLARAGRAPVDRQHEIFERRQHCPRAWWRRRRPALISGNHQGAPPPPPACTLFNTWGICLELDATDLQIHHSGWLHNLTTRAPDCATLSVATVLADCFVDRTGCTRDQGTARGGGEEYRGPHVQRN